MISSVEGLRFAQKYPFTSAARKIVEGKKLSLAGVPDSVLARAKAMVLACAKSQPYTPKISAASKEMLENEVLAFPVAKILVSLVKSRELNERFSFTMAKTAFRNLMNEVNRNKVLLDLAGLFELEFDLPEEMPAMIKISLADFLSAPQKFGAMNLVNLKVEKGFVFLHENEFLAFLASLVFQKIFSSLPVDTKSAPPKFRAEARILGESLVERRKRTFEIMLGKIDLNAFPPCYASMHADLAGSKNLPHNARFHLTTFLVAAGMPTEQIISLFKNTPNFKEKITRYQVERIAGATGTRYSPANCGTLKEHQLCLANEDCKGVKHPVQFYKRKLFAARRQKSRKQKTFR